MRWLPLVVVLAVACDLPSERTVSVPTRGTASRGEIPNFMRTRAAHAAGQAHLHRMAARVPSFAGVFRGSDGAYVIMLVGGAYADRAREVFLADLARERPWQKAPSVQFRQAMYTFEQLSAWRESIFEAIVGVEGWSALWIQS